MTANVEIIRIETKARPDWARLPDGVGHSGAPVG